MSRTARAEQKRREILDAALVVFADKGYHAAGIADIAAELNIGHGTFYRYFRNKLDIFAAVLARIMEDIQGVLTREPPTTTSLAEYEAQLHRIGRGLFDVFMRDLRSIRIVFFEALAADPQIRDGVMQALDVSAALTRAYLDNGVRRGFLRADLDTDIASRAVNAVIFEGAKRILAAGDPEREAQLWVEHGVQMMLLGVAGKR